MPNTLTIKDITIEYLGHSGFVIHKGNHAIVIDPFLIGAPLATKTPKDIFATDILITHGHGDHVGDSIEIAKNNDVPITTIFGVAQYCESLGAKISSTPLGGTKTFDWGIARFRPAVHNGLFPNGESFDAAAGILLEFDGLKIYHTGDTALNYDLKLVGEIYKPDIALITISGKASMDIEEALIAAQWLKAKKVIPMHWDMGTEGNPNPEDFVAKLKQIGIEGIALRP